MTRTPSLARWVRGLAPSSLSSLSLSLSLSLGLGFGSPSLSQPLWQDAGTAKTGDIESCKALCRPEAVLCSPLPRRKSADGTAGPASLTGKTKLTSARRSQSEACR